MLKQCKHIVAVLLLLLFVGETGLAVAAGFSQCQGRCGCCEQPHLMAASAHAKTPIQHPVQQLRGEYQGGCCMPSLLSDCDQDEARVIALVPSPPRPGQQASQIMRLNTSASVADTLSAVGSSAPDPYAANLLARAITIPIYEQTAVFLC